MPKMGGRELVEKLREVCKDFKVIYMSGYTDNATIHHGVLDKGIDLIQKPFSMESLLKKIRHVLDEN